MSTARYYYALQLAFTAAWWAFVTLATKKKPHELAYGPVFDAPRWLSSTLLLRFSRWRAYIFAALPISLALGVFASDHSLWKAKIIVAIAASFYHLTESAFTSAHAASILCCTRAGRCCCRSRMPLALRGASPFILSSRAVWPSCASVELNGPLQKRCGPT